jgi:CPA2 family monovalent cation:H+ antiporter-2
LVCHGYFSFLPYSKKAKHLLTDDDVNYLTCTLSYDGNFSLCSLPALGAFIMGSIIAETTQAEHIEHLIP